MKTYYIYVDHLNCICFWSDEDLDQVKDTSYDEYDYDPLYCESCGDSDYLIGILELESPPSDEQMKELYFKSYDYEY